MKTLIIVEHDEESIKSATLCAITAAKHLDSSIDLFIAGSQCQKILKQASELSNINRVLLADNDVYAYQLAENYAVLIANQGKDYNYIIAGATTFSKNILPRVAALLDVAMISDVMQIISADTFIRPIYAGNVMATMQSADRIKVMTIRTTSFSAVLMDDKGGAVVDKISDIIPNNLSQFEHHTLTQSKRPELTSARVVVSGGRGLKSAENFKLLEEIADCLNAAIGASRAAVDAGFAPNDYQVGQTGKVVAPDLYIAIGISGAIQHVAGMKDSKIIVAINNDPDAPIFQVADYCLVGDLFKILPELRQELERKISRS